VTPVGATDELLAPLHDHPSSSAVLLDFDGTLAAIVDDPAAARPLPGAVDLLLAIRARGTLVAVVSGRPVSFLAGHVPPAIALFGLYGLERRIHGAVVADPRAAVWRPVVDEVAELADAAFPEEGIVERKGLSLTLHFRRHPERADEGQAWAAEAARSSGLAARPAKMSIELHPPVAADKGTVVDELVVGRSAACFVGDDLGDAPAFDAMDRFAAAGGHAVRVLVRTPETAPELVPRADLEVDGPLGTLALLQTLASS
jgi:trehalose 6-phosphate phosphatase